MSAMSSPASSDLTDAVVFDFGGVLITPITNQISTIAVDLGVDAGVLKSVLMGPEVSGTHPWHRAERGELAIAEIQTELGPWAEAAGVRLAGDEIERVMASGQYDVIDAMLERIDRLNDEGVPTVLLTNTFAEFRDTMEADIGLGRFGVVVESFAAGARKPEPAIYAAVESALADLTGADGHRIVYLDDFVENLAPAASRGWHTIHVTAPDQALAALDAHLAD